MENLDQLYELCESVMRELEKTNEKLRMSGGDITSGDMEYLDKLTHTLKSIKTTIAMMESEDDYSSEDGYSSRNYGRRSNRMERGSYARNGSYARRRRDSMGRYSRDDGFREMLEEAMNEAPNESIRSQLRSMIQSM